MSLSANLQGVLPSAMVPKGVAKGGDMFQSGDLVDAAVKTVPIVLIQQVICKFMYRHKFGQNIGKHLVDSFAAILLGNAVDRNVTVLGRAT